MIHRQNYWIPFAVTAASAATSAGFSLAAISADQLSLYAASRSVALLLAAGVLAFWRSPTALTLLAAVMTVVQLLDGLIGLAAGDLAKTAGPFVLAVLTAVCAWSLLRRVE